MYSRIISLMLACCLLAFASASSQTTVLQRPITPTKHHTQVSLVANVASIQPGVPFSVGVLMKMEKGWHTYWKNSGEAGLPTQVDWDIPNGFVAGEIAWPLPHKYNENGEVITYGYQDENMLLVTITPPEDLSPGSSVTLAASINWLECERICVPGSGAAKLTLPVSSGRPSPANGALFARYTRQIPQPITRESPIFVASMTKDGIVEMKVRPLGGATLVITEELPDFFPEAIEALSFGRTKVNATLQEATIQVPVQAYEKAAGPFMLKGVLVYQNAAGQRQSGVLEIALSTEFCSALPLVGEQPAQVGLLDRPFVGESVAGDELPIYFYVLLALVGGLLLNIMPCVLPVIALKIFGLVRMSGDHPAEVKKHGLSFSAGILASFLALAALVLILQAAGSQVGWGFQFQEPLFIIAMSVIVFAFGLSLFGVFEVGLLFMLAFAGLGSALEKKASEGKGYTASFSEGVFATILATPCSAPFLGTALGFAFSRPPLIILLIFTSVAVGMALPYVILTAKPAWMRFLPKPGEWMETAKQFMGFLMMGTLVWLLYILGKQLGMEAVIWTTAFLLVVGMGCWLIGRFATLNASRPKFITTWVVAVLLGVAGYWLFLETMLDIRGVIAGVPTTAQAAISNEADGIQWRSFTLAGLEAELNENRTVFIDFTAEWCLTCKVNERTVLTDKDVVEKFRAHALVAIKADWTNRNPDITRLLAKFGRSGVPLYVIFPAGKPTEPIILPEVITSGIVIDAINRATGSAAER